MRYLTELINHITSRENKTETGLILIMISVLGQAFLGSMICGLIGLVWLVSFILGMAMIFKGRYDHSRLHELCIIAAIFFYFFANVLSVVIIIQYPAATDEEDAPEGSYLVSDPPKIIWAGEMVLFGLVELLLIFGISGTLMKVLMGISILLRGAIPWIYPDSVELMLMITVVSLVIFFVAYITTYRRVKYGYDSGGGFWGRKKADEDEWDPF